jgi:hypothetical protein
MKTKTATSSPSSKMEEIIQSISQPKFDLDFYSRLTLDDGQIRDEIVRQMLNNPEIMIYYHCFYVVEKASQQKPELFYGYWPEFAALLKHANSYHRDFGLILIAILTRVDTENRIKEILPEYLSHAQDQKFMTACCCVQNCKMIIQSKPVFKEKIFTSLLDFEKTSPYSESQKALMKFHLLEIIQQNWVLNVPETIFIEYIHDSLQCVSPKTRKKAKDLVARYNL